MQEFINYLENIVLEKLPEKTLKELTDISKTLTFKSDDIILKNNTIPKNIFFVKSGIVSASSVDMNEKKCNYYLYQANDSITPIHCINNKIGSKFTYKALTECSLLEIDYLKLLEKSYTSPNLLNLLLKLIELNYNQMDQRVMNLQSLDATQAYLKIQKDIPNIENLIPQYQIASYINVTPVQLSRVRKKLFKNSKKTKNIY